SLGFCFGSGVSSGRWNRTRCTGGDGLPDSRICLNFGIAAMRIHFSSPDLRTQSSSRSSPAANIRRTSCSSMPKVWSKSRTRKTSHLAIAVYSLLPDLLDADVQFTSLKLADHPSYFQHVLMQ